MVSVMVPLMLYLYHSLCQSIPGHSYRSRTQNCHNMWPRSYRVDTEHIHWCLKVKPHNVQENQRLWQLCKKNWHLKYFSITMRFISRNIRPFIDMAITFTLMWCGCVYETNRQLFLSNHSEEKPILYTYCSHTSPLWIREDMCT